MEDTKTNYQELGILDMEKYINDCTPEDLIKIQKLIHKLSSTTQPNMIIDKQIKNNPLLYNNIHLRARNEILLKLAISYPNRQFGKYDNLTQDIISQTLIKCGIIESTNWAWNSLLQSETNNINYIKQTESGGYAVEFNDLIKYNILSKWFYNQFNATYKYKETNIWAIGTLELPVFYVGAPPKTKLDVFKLYTTITGSSLDNIIVGDKIYITQKDFYQLGLTPSIIDYIISASEKYIETDDVLDDVFENNKYAIPNSNLYLQIGYKIKELNSLVLCMQITY
jgi:hypothetical protein